MHCEPRGILIKANCLRNNSIICESANWNITHIFDGVMKDTVLRGFYFVCMMTICTM